MKERVVISRSGHRENAVNQEFPFVSDFVLTDSIDSKHPEFVKKYQANALSAYKNLSMPSTSDEPWRRTDLRGLPVANFRLPNRTDRGAIEPEDLPTELLKPLTGEQHGGQIIQTVHDTKLQLVSDLRNQGIVLTDFQMAERDYPQIMENILGKIVLPAEGKFAALVGAFEKKGVLVYVPKGVQLDRPLHSILWGSGENLALLSHILVWVDEGASLTFVHEAASSSQNKGQLMHAGIVEILVSERAQLKFVELQSWGKNVWNFSHERVRLERDASLDWIFGAIGSRMTKNFSEIELAGQGSTGRMSGFYFTDRTQHLDHDTQQNHLAPDTTSDLLFKGALRDKSRSVWQGMIYVAPGAQKSDGYQLNRNLVLSKDARADSIPGLEILADDVRCSHGATVGKIDQDQVFYSQSRGISLHESERLIVEGFFDPIMQRIPFEGVRGRFQKAIEEKMA